MPSSSRLPAKSFRHQRDRTGSRNAESYQSEEDGDDTMVSQQYDMFRDLFQNGHDPRVICHTMISCGLDPNAVLPKHLIKQRSRSKSHTSRRPGGTLIKNKKGRKGPVKRRNELNRSNSLYDDNPNPMLQSGYGFADQNNSDMYRRNNSYVTTEERNGSFNEMALTASGDMRPASTYQAVPIDNAPANPISVSRDMRSSRYDPLPSNNTSLTASGDMRSSRYQPAPPPIVNGQNDTRPNSRYHEQNDFVPEANSSGKTWVRHKEFQPVPLNQATTPYQQSYSNDNATVYSTDAMSALSASRRNRGFIRKEKTSRGVIENLPQLSSGRNLPQSQYPPQDSRSYVPPPPPSEIGSVTSRTKRTFIRRNNTSSQRALKRQSGNSQATMQPVTYNRQPKMNPSSSERNLVSPRPLRKPKKQRSSATLPSAQSYASTNHSSSLEKQNRRSQRPTRVATNIPLATERRKGGVELKLYPYDSDVYKPFKVMQILGHYPTQIIEALENAGLDPCVLYKGVDVNRHPNEPIKVQAAQDKWELKYSKRYFTHYYQNKNTGETLWKDEVDKIAAEINSSDTTDHSALLPHHITDDDI